MGEICSVVGEAGEDVAKDSIGILVVGAFGGGLGGETSENRLSHNATIAITAPPSTPLRPLFVLKTARVKPMIIDTANMIRARGQTNIKIIPGSRLDPNVAYPIPLIRLSIDPGRAVSSKPFQKLLMRSSL